MKGSAAIPMLIAFDVGNTHTKIGVFDGPALKRRWRMATDKTRSADELGVTIRGFFKHDELDFSLIDGVIISSVAPSLNYTFEHMSVDYLKQAPMFIEPGIKTGINIKYDNPKELGSDRIINSIAAYELYGGPCIIVDFGTATTFSVVSCDGELLGGAICPGIKVSLQALIDKTSRLQHVELIKPDKIINRTTALGMQGGFIYGFSGLVDNIANKIRGELCAPDARVIATGGLSYLIKDESLTIDEINPQLSLHGLRIIYERNKK